MTEHERFIRQIEEWRDHAAREAGRAERMARNERLNDFIQEENSPFLDAELKQLELRPSTKKQYLGYLKRFMRFVSTVEFDGELGATALPASPGLVGYWLMSELNDGATYAAIRGMKAAISNAHHDAKVADPTNHKFVRAWLLYARKNWKDTHSYAKRRRAETSTTQQEIEQ